MPNHSPLASQGALVVKDQSASYIEMQLSSLGWEDSLEEGIATHSGILENSMDRGAWRTAIHRVEKSRT